MKLFAHILGVACNVFLEAYGKAFPKHWEEPACLGLLLYGQDIKFMTFLLPA